MEQPPTMSNHLHMHAAAAHEKRALLESRRSNKESAQGSREGFRNKTVAFL